MKKVIVSLLLAMTLTLSAFAQDSANAMNEIDPTQNQEGVIMKDGKLLMMRNGQTTQLTSDLTLDNGTVVMADGNVKTKEGTTSILKEGEYVGMDGTFGNIKTKWAKNDLRKDSGMPGKMKPDSAK